MSPKKGRPTRFYVYCRPTLTPTIALCMFAATVLICLLILLANYCPNSLQAHITNIQFQKLGHTRSPIQIHQNQTNSRIIQLIIKQNCHVTETSHNNIEESSALVLAGIFPLLSGLPLTEIPNSQNARDKPNPRNSNLSFSISESPMKSHTQSQSWPAQSLSRKTLMPTPHDLASISDWMS